MTSNPTRTIVLMPLFNDWASADSLLVDLDNALAGREMFPEVLIVDDGSTLPMPPGFAVREFKTIRSVDILELRRNLGHQRAIAVGIVYIHENLPCKSVVIMDADGQDRPSDIPAIAAAFAKENGRAIIFAARAKRLENLLFRTLYHVYRLLHWLLTGDAVRVGNFSMVPFESVKKLVVIPEIWNHYAAAAIRSRLAFKTIPIPRGRRITGGSKMNFIGLLLHGLSAFFVYGDIVGARLLVGIAIALLVQTVVVIAGLSIYLTESLGPVGLAAVIAGILGIFLIQTIPVALILVFTVVGSRATIGVVPLRDCPYFISGVRRL